MAGAAVGAFTGGVGWALAIGGTTAVAGAQVGRARPDRATRRNARLTRATTECLDPLRNDGWRLLHARAIGQDPDRVYHLCVPPSANTVMVLMDWAWPTAAEIYLDEDGALHSGALDGDIAVEWVLEASQTVRDALERNRKTLGSIGVGQVLPVHQATVANEGHLQFHRDYVGEKREINIVHANVLLEKMRTVSGDGSRRTRRAARHFADFLNNTFP
ncbi:hypothetical protein GCM10009577_36390 [Streptomyces javensis]